MKTKLLCIITGIFMTLGAVIWAAESDRFRGGWYDGYARQSTPGYVSLAPPSGTLFVTW